jgi:hypothetical protein
MMASVTKKCLKSCGRDREWCAAGVGEPGARDRADQQRAQERRGEGPVLGADLPLEQQWHRRVPDLLADVVERRQRDCSSRAAQSADDGGQDVRQFWADQLSAVAPTSTVS